MEVYGSGWLEQQEPKKQKYRCRRWRICFRTEDGKRRKYFIGSYRDALQAKDDFYLELIGEKCSSSITFDEYSQKWLEWRKSRKELSSCTILKNTYSINSLSKWFGKYKMSEISPSIIKDVMANYTSAKGNKLSGTTENYHFICFNMIMQSAVDDKIILENPFKSIKLPKIDTQEKRALNKEEFKQTIKCLDSEAVDGRSIAIYLMLYLGLRRQEAVALLWKDIDFKKNKIHIQRAYKNVDKSVGKPKTKAGNRFLPIPDPLREKLTEWHSSCEKHGLVHDNVCISTRYTPLTPNALKHWYVRFIRRNNLTYVSFHELRHTNLTIAARKMNQFDLQRYAGWSSLAPAQIYIHADDESLEKSVSNMFV